MARARASLEVPGPVEAAEALWYDTTRWAAWVDGFAGLRSIEGDWPAPGAIVTWESHPGGRGTVTERVVAHEQGSGQALAVEDDSVMATQRVAFRAAADGTRVALELEWGLKRGGPLNRLVDVLFIRRAQRDALRRTLGRFARELGDEPAQPLR